MVVKLADGNRDGVVGVGQDVPDEKDEDPDGQGVEELPELRGRSPHATDREPEEDAPSGDQPQQDDPRLAHNFPLVTTLGIPNIIDEAWSYVKAAPDKQSREPRNSRGGQWA